MAKLGTYLSWKAVMRSPPAFNGRGLAVAIFGLDKVQRDSHRFWVCFTLLNRGRKGLPHRLGCDSGLYQSRAFVTDNILAPLRCARIL